ncbi:fumarylacetoacetase [Oceanobacillus timonensis]|uniref:fumarylacetoacetase n=1 Tax=Oceanobacillus timonensis TaxID=1926285 RepID=UPI0015C44FB5|nr:fumarylacetoacetase [Oceanobacillus timonensis]
MKKKFTTAVDFLAKSGFGVENLPYGSVYTDEDTVPRLVVRLGDHAIDLGSLTSTVGGLGKKTKSAVTNQPNLDALLAAGRPVWSELRNWIRQTLTDPDHTKAVEAVATNVNDVNMAMPFTVTDYVDFYASENHASNLGRILRPDEEPLKPNWKHLPVGYHGRASTVSVSGTPVYRPKGIRPEKGTAPSFGSSRRLDIEAELGFIVGGSAPQGEVSLAQAAENHLFGVVLFNDWSARDIQAFESVPLGPNLSKSFASTISAWVVPWDALDAARVVPPVRDESLVQYLDDSSADPYGLDISVEVYIDDQHVSTVPYSTMYWTAPQMLAHMTVNGATLSPGDFFGSGTISGPEPDQCGSLIELTLGGEEPLTSRMGEKYNFLQDGQQVTLRGSAPGPMGSTIGFGECTGTIRPAT